MAYRNPENHFGEVNTGRFGTPMKIIEYKNSNDLTVEFQDSFMFRTKTHYQNFKNGSVMNPYDKSYMGVGYRGIGKHQELENGKKTRKYITWHGILQRSYDEIQLTRNPAYRGTSVCQEWHNFQIFGDWFDENYYEVPNERTEIDKDILVRGNHVYSPDTCIFVPQSVNLMFSRKRNFRGEYPCGVTKTKSGKFNVICGHNGVVENLGVFDNIPDAFRAYKSKKEEVVKSKADRLKEYLPKRVYDALYAWEAHIED